MSDARSHSNADGAGALLGLAAGDQLAALQRSAQGPESLYGFRTQQATVVAYHLLRWGEIRSETLQSELVEMAYHRDAPSAYRGEPEWFVAFLERAKSGSDGGPTPPTDGAAPLTLPVGLWYRWDMDRLLAESVVAASITHSDGTSLAAGCALSGAAAAASFGQHGRDFLNAVTELTSEALAVLNDRDVPDVAGAADVARTLGEADRWLEQRAPVVISGCTDELGPAGRVVAAVVLGAVGWERSEDAVRSTAGFPEVAPLVGGIIGARRGLAHWPWDMPNEHWFAEIGRRLVAGDQSFEDLPDPYAVEVTMVDPTSHRIF